MMSCDKYAQMISPYLDAELDEHLTQEVKDHLAICSHCKKMFAVEAQVEHYIATAVKADASTQIAWEHALQAFEARHPKVPPLFPPSVWIGLSALFLVFFASLGIQRWYFQDNDLMLAAVSNHKKYVTDQMDVKIFANQAGEVEQYFEGKLPFSIRLPRQYNPASIQLVGASKRHLDEVPVAFVVYAIDREPTSVFILDHESAGKFEQIQAAPQESARLTSHVYGDKTVSTRITADRVMTAVSNLSAERLESFLDDF